MKITGIILSAIILLINTLSASADIKSNPGLGLQTPDQVRGWIKKAAKAQAAIPECSIVSFYTGKPYDKNSGIYIFGFRNYNPEFGRWTAIDPTGFPDGPNGWLYVGNNVMNDIDPDGCQIITISGTYTDTKTTAQNRISIPSGTTITHYNWALHEWEVSVTSGVTYKWVNSTTIPPTDVITGNQPSDPTLLALNGATKYLGSPSPPQIASSSSSTSYSTDHLSRTITSTKTYTWTQQAE